MRHLVFGGCSFTHSGDSWAYCARPLAYEPIYDSDGTLDHFGLNACGLGDPDRHPNPRTTQDTLRMQRKWHTRYHRVDDPEYDSLAFIQKCKMLNVDQYRICFAGEGAASVSLTARSVINYLEKTPGVDTVVFQITGFARREVLTLNQQYLELAKMERGDDEIYTMDGLTFIKQEGTLNVEMVKSENSRNLLRKYSAYYADFCADVEEFYIRALDQLQLLTQYCILNNINIGYFHGWDNVPEQWSTYCEGKYNNYVRPYLITDENIIDYYTKKYPDKNPYDFNFDEMANEVSLGSHPHAFAHREFWNDLVYPFVK
jgi:hypothetical protein